MTRDQDADLIHEVTIAHNRIVELKAENERLCGLLQEALRGLRNDFEPDNQSKLYYRLEAALKNQQQKTS